jgi:GTP cyclohydrolase II
MCRVRRRASSPGNRLRLITPRSPHSQAAFRTAIGDFRLHAFECGAAEHSALVHGDPAASPNAPLIRIQSACLTGSAFLAELCDCRQQLHESMRRIVANGAGIVVYMDQEGRGHGLVEKVAQLDLIAAGADTADAPALRGLRGDLRTYEDAAAILHELLGERAVRLMTNNPTKLLGVREAGVRVLERVPIETAPTAGNREYLRVKKLKLGHILEQV